MIWFITLGLPAFAVAIAIPLWLPPLLNYIWPERRRAGRNDVEQLFTETRWRVDDLFESGVDEMFRVAEARWRRR